MSIITSFHPHSLNGSEEVQERKGGLKKGVQGEERVHREGEAEGDVDVAWQDFDTQQSRLCMHDETKKSEKGAATGKIAFRMQYTLLITIIQLIKYTRVFSS